MPSKGPTSSKLDLHGRERAIPQDRVDCDHDDDYGRAKIPDRNAVIRVPGRFRPGYWRRTLHELPPSHARRFEEAQRNISPDLGRRTDVIRYETREAASAADLGQPTPAAGTCFFNVRGCDSCNWSCVDTRTKKPSRNILAGLGCRPKALCDSALPEARFPAILLRTPSGPSG